MAARSTPSPPAFAVRPASPVVTPSGGSLNQRLSSLAQAISRKADITAEPTYNGIQLIAADGSTWRVTIDPSSGQLQTTLVARP